MTTDRVITDDELHKMSIEDLAAAVGAGCLVNKDAFITKLMATLSTAVQELSKANDATAKSIRNTEILLRSLDAHRDKLRLAVEVLETAGMHAEAHIVGRGLRLDEEASSSDGRLLQ